MHLLDEAIALDPRYAEAYARKSNVISWYGNNYANLEELPKTRVEALRLYTEGAAWFSFDDHQVGSFIPGKYADLAVLSHDYLTVSEQAIRRIESMMTMVGGKIVHAIKPFV